MFGNTDTQDRLRRDARLLFAPAAPSKEQEPDLASSDEGSCPAFGYRLDARDRALALQLRFQSGNSDWFPYAWLGPWRFVPQAGLLLRFTGDVISLVLVRGRNLDSAVNGVNLTDRGLQRHRITWIREMDEDALRMAGKGEPVIEAIEVAEWETNEQAVEWLKRSAPAFVR